MLNYYIDESGNSGDTLNSGRNLDFNGQSVFSLACIGLNDVSKLDGFIAELKKKYKVQGTELKSTNIYKNKPSLIVDLIEYLGNEKVPIFIEAVDKKYYIAANLVNCHVMPPYFSPPESVKSQLVRNHFADFIYEHATEKVFERFFDVCREPSDRNLMLSFEEILSFSKGFSSGSELAKFISKNIEESIDDYKNLKESEGENAYKRFIPLPDGSKRDKSIWMLPNLSSFTNIYARINLFLGGNISNAKLYHDEQAHFDDILRLNKRLLEGLGVNNTISVPTAKYDFSEVASLSFAKSHEHLAIQVSDVLAGMVMRYLQEHINGRKSHADVVKAYDEILRTSDPLVGVGINLVTTSKVHHELHYKIRTNNAMHATRA